MPNGYNNAGSSSWDWGWSSGNPINPIQFPDSSFVFALPHGLDFVADQTQTGSSYFLGAPTAAESLLDRWVGSPLMASTPGDELFSTPMDQTFDLVSFESFGGFDGLLDACDAVIPNYRYLRCAEGNPATALPFLGGAVLANPDGSVAASTIIIAESYTTYANAVESFSGSGASYSGFSNDVVNFDDICGQWPKEGFPFFPPQVNKVTCTITAP